MRRQTLKVIKDKIFEILDDEPETASKILAERFGITNGSACYMKNMWSKEKKKEKNKEVAAW